MGCPLLSSRALWRRLRHLPCSSVCGLHCTGPTNARQSQWETVISCVGGQVFLVRLGGESSAMRAVHVAIGCSMKEGSTISVSFWLRMLGRGVLAFGHGTVCSLSLELGALVLSLRPLFVKNLLSSWWTGVAVVLALILARLLLRGCCPFVPRSLPLVLCGGGAGPGLTRACSPGYITAYGLETGPWALLPHSYSSHPLPSLGVVRLGVRVCLHILKCCLYLLEILDFIS